MILLRQQMIKENLKKIRQELGLSAAKLSEKLNIPAPTLVCYERGERTPSAQLFMKLNYNLNINLNWFVTGKGEMFNTIPHSEPDERAVLNNIIDILKRNKFI